MQEKEANLVATKVEKSQLVNDKPQRVDFAHPESCTGTRPVNCIIEGKSFSGVNWRDILVALVENFLQNKPIAETLCRMSVFSKGERPFLLKEKPKLSARQISNGYWINVNLSIKDLVVTIGELCRFCGVDLNDVDITYVSKKSIGGILQMNINKYNSAPTVPETVIDVLQKNYASGFRFDMTYINLLSNASGINVDIRMQETLKRIMFRRNDGIYFLLDTIADAVTRKDIVDFSDIYLEKYGCFEIPEFYKLFEEKVNANCIRNADDFENFYEQIGKSGVRCVQAPYFGNRIARYRSGSVWSTFEELAAKIVVVITDEYYGSCSEDDLHTKFCAFSTDLLCKIIKQCAAGQLIRVEINESICYQTFNALGLPENFSEQLAETLECLDDIGLEPAQNTLHTAVSLKLGVNFMEEYNLPDWETYRRLIAATYKAEPRREWKYNIFGKVTK